MSLQYCEKCDQWIDTDNDAEHFADEANGCIVTFECSMSPECPCDDCRRENIKMD